MDCMDEKTLSSYIDEKISKEERSRIEGHISSCNRCLDLLLVAHDAEANDRMKRVKKKKNPGLKWFLGAVFLFALSFVFKGYFLQLLVAAAILGFKWAMEGEGARRVVMIFKGMQNEEKDFERKIPPYVSSKRGGDRYGEKQ